MIGTGVIEADGERPEFDFSGAERWHVLVLHRGSPAARVDLPALGLVAGEALADAALRRRADAERARQALVADLRQRLGAWPEPEAELTISVVVCTHRRPAYLEELLRSLAALDPAPLEVVVVDNDPGDQPCREGVEAVRFRYVREDRRGLDNARNAGIQAARGEVVAFVDDDCVVPPGWLAPLRGAFASESVAAVTGPGFPLLLDTTARERMEEQASLARGLRRERFDWQTISPLHAAAMGIGANMAIRRQRLEHLPGPFPPELDAGTSTESGGDTYVLSRLLAAGGRVVYEPRSYLFHQHRDDWASLRRAVLGYGIGLSAALTKLVVEDRELSAPRAWAWLPRQYLQTQRRRLVGRADAVNTRLSWEYLRGGFLGAGRWRRSPRDASPALAAAATLPFPTSVAPRPAPAPSSGGAGSTEAAAAAGAAPELSVVIPTFRREAALRRCLAALAGQDVDPGSFEVVVVDDDPDGELHPLARQPFLLRRLRSPGEGAAAARNHGAREAGADLVLFLDDDIVADPWLLRTHLEWHGARGGAAVLVGPYRPSPRDPGLAAAVARLWWSDFFERLAGAPAPTFVSALTANLSLPRSLFGALGGFSERYARQRREDWEWGLRVRRAGVEIAYEPGASARHEYSLGTAQRLRDAAREGFGDALIVPDYPEALAALPLAGLRYPASLTPRWLALRLAGTKTGRWLFLRLLAGLEWARLRHLWLRAFEIGQGLAYARGARAAGWQPGSTEPEVLEVDLLDRAPIAAPAVATPLLRITVAGREVAMVAPEDAVWTGAITEQIADAVAPEEILRAAGGLGWLQDPVATARAESTDVIAVGRDSRWDDVLAAIGAAGDAGRAFVALRFAAAEDDGSWLEEALAAFDASRVGLCFGGSRRLGDPSDPLYLHDRGTADASLLLGEPLPAYLVLRSELAAELPRPSSFPLGVVLAVEAALEAGWAIGHREVRGLGPPTFDVGAWGAAYGAFESRSATSLPGRARRRRRLERLLQGAAILGWSLLKNRGLGERERRLALAVLRGAAAERGDGR
jgi:glycosyltransferase involved in cell wall biosynthesis